MEQVTREEMDTYQRKAWTVRLLDPTRSQACEVCTLEESDEWWTYQPKIGNSFPLLYEVCQCVSPDIFELNQRHVSTFPGYP